tara:strand:- start:6473 stop:6643 length:171 start_codon:yes stop_codon:yes gene_type:complete
MRARFIIPGTRKRAMIRSSDSESLCAASNVLKEMGYKEVGLAGMVKHILFWWSKKK